MKFGGWNGTAHFKKKKCAVCQKAFQPKSGVSKLCSTACRVKWKYITGTGSTEEQYKRISGNWSRYFSRLAQNSRRKFKAPNLSADVLLRMLKQQKGRCALSGIQLTCLMQVGVVTDTNASVDRIDCKGQYTLGNVQLVAQSLNHFKYRTSMARFIWWCKKVADYN